ncbi:hypothetical protein CBER1_09062 [Cercospora berteroae]|uniref:Uncharacterized protein n=1 Tax=Cercospora berteroae TaxID=357750 RepID=A0A2S6BWM3_9PEZI|nr:hypothetical protein CBER1_09062 [Cercospora berteroae]
MEDIEAIAALNIRDDGNSDDGDDSPPSPPPCPRTQDMSSNVEELNGTSDGANGIQTLKNRDTRLLPDDEQPEKNHYLHIHQGDGGLFQLPLQFTSLTGKVTQDIKAVGTTSCYTCVGVFVPVSDKHFFAAHIDAHNCEEHEEELESAKDNKYWVLTDQESGTNLIKRVRELLREEFQNFFRQHPECSEGKFPGVTNGNAIIICPRTEVEDKRATGSWVLQAVCEFFGLPVGVTDVACGFIKPLGNPTSAADAIYLYWRRQRTHEAAIAVPEGVGGDETVVEYYQVSPNDHGMYAVNGRPWSLSSHGKKWLRMSSYAELMSMNGVE